MTANAARIAWPDVATALGHRLLGGEQTRQRGGNGGGGGPLPHRHRERITVQLFGGGEASYDSSDARGHIDNASVDGSRSVDAAGRGRGAHEDTHGTLSRPFANNTPQNLESIGRHNEVERRRPRG
eukprot:CAMPEP_0175908634 /NCGR_PEP_ID=MMETSP0108-20121206/6693_1 /TAXON_ID=195067 ORGANISM="Goniomonas pacifica, Strain CCMP1869" /NCGR_SAMPLE_ID=MMETSP0108 /ASSEMBLY_ACC=CAM_ASM_000204 /LENGTH=125 /DNA_ID=CAMNT_0017230683 /DNA_START=176 /DNA_END=553 /DNA_ORIENTATION=+